MQTVRDDYLICVRVASFLTGYDFKLLGTRLGGYRMLSDGQKYVIQFAFAKRPIQCNAVHRTYIRKFRTQTVETTSAIFLTV